MSPDTKQLGGGVRFGIAPARLRVVNAGQREHAPFAAAEAVDFQDPRDRAPPDPAALERARLALEERRRAAAALTAKREAEERDSRLDSSLAAIRETSAALRAELAAELEAIEPLLAKLALGIADRALRHGIANDPLLLEPAIAAAVGRLRKDVDAPGLVTIAVAPSCAGALGAALERHAGNGELRVVSDAALAAGAFEVRSDVRRIRHSIERELAAVSGILGGDGRGSP